MFYQKLELKLELVEEESYQKDTNSYSRGLEV
jgi:hypothetical protein